MKAQSGKFIRIWKGTVMDLEAYRHARDHWRHCPGIPQAEEWTYFQRRLASGMWVDMWARALNTWPSRPDRAHLAIRQKPSW